MDRQVVRVAREGGVVQSTVGGVSEREKSIGYSDRSGTCVSVGGGGSKRGSGSVCICAWKQGERGNVWLCVW